MTTFPHVRLNAEGALGHTSQNEIWSCGMKVGLTISGSPDTLVAAAQTDVDELSAAGLAAWTTYITLAGSGPFSGLFSNWTNLGLVRAAAVVASGHDDPALHSTATDVAGPTSGAAPTGSAANIYGECPYQVSLVQTLTGDLYPRGSAAYGRFYVPCPNLHTDPTGTAPLGMADGLIQSVAAGRFALATVHLIQAINATTLTTGKIATVCNIGQSTDLAGLRFQPVTNVTVDGRPDTVRRRYNKITGNYKVTVAV